MRKLFLSLLICIILSLTINFVVYSDNLQPVYSEDSVDMTFDPSKIPISSRQTSEGLMVEIRYKDYSQWFINYQYLLIESLSKDKTIKQWEEQYNQLLKDTVWKDSFDKCLQTVETVELDYQNEKQKSKRLTYGLIGSSIIIAIETFILIVR